MFRFIHSRISGGAALILPLFRDHQHETVRACVRASVPAPGVVAVRAANEPRFPSSPMVSEFVRPWHGRLVRSVWSTKAPSYVQFISDLPKGI